MSWVILLLSAVLEAVWATALGASHGITRLVPSVVFALALSASMAGLGYAAKHIAISTAYAVWTGTGAALTVAWGMVTGAEAVTSLRVVFLAGIIAAVIGLKLVRAQPGEPGAAQREPAADPPPTTPGPRPARGRGGVSHS